MKTPKFSIITICYNAAAQLEQTIQSVLCQDCTNLEYILVDGASTDSTAAILDKYNTDIDHLISEPDDGIADAMYYFYMPEITYCSTTLSQWCWRIFRKTPVTISMPLKFCLATRISGQKSKAEAFSHG